MRRFRGSRLAPVLILAMLAACGGGEAPDDAGEDEIYDTETPVEEGGPAVEPSPAPVATEYAPSLGVDLAAMRETPTGLRYQDVEEGTGATAAPGDTVAVHYTGWLPDGTRFDSSHDRGEAFEFVLGQGRVIPGWEEGVAGMEVGGRRRLVIPPDLGYGASGAGEVIPPGATLVFEVDLLEVR